MRRTDGESNGVILVQTYSTEILYLHAFIIIVREWMRIKVYLVWSLL